MKNSNSSGSANKKTLPKHISEMPERQREAMQKARKDGTFNGQAHLENSPIGRAVASGFPLIRR